MVAIVQEFGARRTRACDGKECYFGRARIQGSSTALRVHRAQVKVGKVLHVDLAQQANGLQ